MKAKILPLKGKYYTTKIEIKTSNGSLFTIDIPRLCNKPSIREIDKLCKSLDITHKQYNENIEVVVDGWGGKQPIQSLDIIDSSHMESHETYKAARYIEFMINYSKEIKETTEDKGWLYR